MAYGLISLEKRLKENIKYYSLENLYDLDEIQRLFCSLCEALGTELLLTERHGEKVVCVGDFSGFEPDVDIPIVYTGLRPGEKMFEECLKEEEGLQKTENDLIFIGKPIEFDREEFFEHLKDLKKTAYEDDPQMKLVVKRLVPSYQVEKSK